jgi:WD40 repeat protein
VILRAAITRRNAWIIAFAVMASHCAIPQQSAAATLPPITAVAIAPDGSAVVAGSQAGVEVRSWPELERTATLPTELTNVHDLAFSPDGKLIAVAGGQPGAEGTVELYGWPGLELVRRVSPHDDVAYAVAWRGDGKELALAGADQRVSLLSASAESPPRYLAGHSRAVLAAAFLPDDHTLLSCGVDASVRVWDTPAMSTRRTLTNHTRAVYDVKVRPNQSEQSLPMVATAAEDRTVRFWQPTIGRMVRFARLESAPLALAWSPDGLLLWAACRDGHVRGIDPDTAAMTRDIPAIDGVAYALVIAPDGTIVIAGSNGQLRRITNE